MSAALHGRVFDDAANDGELDVHGIGRAVARRKWQVIVTTLVAVVATAIYVNVVAPRYTGEAQVLVENQENYFTQADNVPPEAASAPDEEAVTSQIQLVTSRDLARDAIKTLGLAGLPEFNPAAGDSSLLARILIQLGIRRAPTDLAVEDRVLQSYYDRLAVSEVAKSRVLAIDFWSEDPELAAKAANTITDLYIGLQADAKRNRARVAADLLATQITALKANAADAQNQAAAFRASANLLVGNNNMTISTQQLADITSQLATARTAAADAQAKAHLIRDMLRQGRLTEVPDVANNELIRQISAECINLRAQIALESRTYLPGHPRIKELNAQLGDLESALKAAAEETARTLENDAQIADTRVVNLQATLDQQKKTVGEFERRRSETAGTRQQRAAPAEPARCRDHQISGGACSPERRVDARRRPRHLPRDHADPADFPQKTTAHDLCDPGGPGAVGGLDRFERTTVRTGLRSGAGAAVEDGRSIDKIDIRPPTPAEDEVAQAATTAQRTRFVRLGIEHDAPVMRCRASRAQAGEHGRANAQLALEPCPSF